MALARRRIIARQGKRHVPQRARAQQLRAVVPDLPVESRERIGKARIRGRSGHDEPTLRIDVDAGEQLPEMDVEVVRKAARDMALEQHGETCAGDRERQQDRHDPAGDQPQPQRGPAHAEGSGTR